MTLPFRLSIPHAGRSIPDRIRNTMALKDRKIRESEDFSTREPFGAMDGQRVVAAASAAIDEIRHRLTAVLEAVVQIERSP